MPLKNKLTFAYVLSGVLAIVLLISSIVGLLYGAGGFYDSYPASLAGLVGQDGVTLVVSMLQPFSLPLFTRVRGRRVLRSSPYQISTKFALQPTGAPQRRHPSPPRSPDEQDPRQTPP
jgi:hypothetical protein